MTQMADTIRGRRQRFAAPGGFHDRMVRLLAVLLPALIGALLAVPSSVEPLWVLEELDGLIAICNLAFFLLANVRPTGNGGVWRTVVALSPFLLAAWIGISRVRDYWHHPSDVATGGVLGAVIAYVVRRAV